MYQINFTRPNVFLYVKGVLQIYFEFQGNEHLIHFLQYYIKKKRIIFDLRQVIIWAFFKNIYLI